jgi:hypothetical protein
MESAGFPAAGEASDTGFVNAHNLSLLQLAVKVSWRSAVLEPISWVPAGFLEARARAV